MTSRKDESMRKFLLRVALVALVLPVLGGSPWDPASVKLRIHSLADGIYAVLPHDASEKDHVATTAGIVVGRNGVLVVESMVNGHLASQLIGEVRKVTSRPIRFLVNTSYHGDHSYGNFAFPRQTVIIQHEATKRYIEQKFEQDRAFMLDLIGKGKGIEEVLPRSAEVTLRHQLAIDLGGKRVEIRHLGFAQTAGDVIVWVPKDKVVWVGNMIQARPPALPWLLEGQHEKTIATLKKLYRLLPEDTIIIPGHGSPMGPNEIGFGIAYLEKLHKEVKMALADGLNLEQTIARVTMPKYRSYSLYEFAHKQVNVPGVYRDLANKK